MQATVLQQCSGLVPVAYEVRSLSATQHFASWLGKYGCLAQLLSLVIGTNHTGPRFEAVFVAIGTALQQAAAAPQGLQLQAVVARTPRLAFLQQLQPCSSLTSLTVKAWWYRKDGDNSCELARVLQGLPSLKDLHISGCRPGQTDGVHPLLPALAGLTRLTSLSWTRQYHPEVLQHLPAQLQRLEFVESKYQDPSECGPAQMSHLTTLSALVNNDKDYAPYVSCAVRAGDQLAPALRVLHVRDILAVQPLLALQHLQQLVVNRCSTPSDELRQLSSSSSLTDLQLWYAGKPQEDIRINPTASAAAWGGLPIRTLHFVKCDLSPSILQHLGSTYRHLTHLSVCSSKTSAAPQQVAAAVAQLTGLQQLELQLECEQLQGAWGQQVQGVQAATCAEGQVAVMQAIAELPRLNSFSTGMRVYKEQARFIGQQQQRWRQQHSSPTCPCSLAV